MIVVYVILGLIILTSLIIGIVLMINEKRQNKDNSTLYDDPEVIFEDDKDEFLDDEII